MAPQILRAGTLSVTLAAAAFLLAVGLAISASSPASAAVTRGAVLNLAPQLQEDGATVKGATVQKAHHRSLRKRFFNKRIHKGRRFHRDRHFHGKRHFRGGRHLHGDRKLHGKGIVRHGGRACHDVVKVGHYRGHKALVGGVMCYDRHGRGYVLDGSRHLVKYLKK